jgi:hypothetical protein
VPESNRHLLITNQLIKRLSPGEMQDGAIAGPFLGVSASRKRASRRSASSSRSSSNKRAVCVEGHLGRRVTEHPLDSLDRGTR